MRNNMQSFDETKKHYKLSTTLRRILQLSRTREKTIGPFAFVEEVCLSSNRKPFLVQAAMSDTPWGDKLLH
jgi:hypothetical protein